MTLYMHNEIEQGTDEWHALRRGIITASVVGQLITPKTVKVASNDYSRALTAQLVAERISGWSEPVYVNADMQRGTDDEPYARDLYSKHYAPVAETGFMINDDWDYQIGYSPDGLIGDDGLIEIKSRRQKKHLTTILADQVPLENMAQIQTGLLVSSRDWCDYVSYCGGLPLYVKRVLPDDRWFNAIISAVEQFEGEAARIIEQYNAAVDGLPMTERIDHYEDIRIS